MSIIAICIPTFGSFSVEWTAARLQTPQPLGSQTVNLYDARPNANIAEKRNDLVRRALDHGADAVLFIGDDVIIPTNLIHEMVKHFERGYHAVTGIYWTKSPNPSPYIWKGYLEGACMDWHVGDFMELDWSGCDCLMISTDVFRTIKPPWFSINYKFGKDQRRTPFGTEDLYLFSLFKEAGIKLFCDTTIQCGHQDRQSGRVIHMPQSYPQAHRGSEIPRKNDLLVAEIAGGEHLNLYHQEADVVIFHKKPELNPDVVCDLQVYPEMSDKFDVVCAWHILEHFPAEKAVDILKEWIRILKPGGTLDIKVPNVDVAFENIKAGNKDLFFHRMLYGRQTDKYEYHLNGFNPMIIRHMLEKVGNLGSVEIDMNDNPHPFWEIRARAKKLTGEKIAVLSDVYNKDKPAIKELDKAEAV